VTDPETKRKTIGNLFIEVFQDEAAAIGKVDYLLQVVHSCFPPGSLSPWLSPSHISNYLLQGTLYPDVIESISYKVTTITTNTGGGGKRR